MKKILSNIVGFAICFILFGFLFKTTEIAWFIIKGIEITSLQCFFYDNIISFGFELALASLLYSILFPISQKAANFIISIVLCTFLCIEICLCIYTFQTGILMGKEIILRPIHEMVETIISTTSIIQYLVILFLYCIYTYLSLFFIKKDYHIILKVILGCVIVISIPLFFICTSSLDKRTTNKTWRCVQSCLKGIYSNYDNLYENIKQTEPDSTLISEYKKIFTDRCTDKYYLLERDNNIPNKLNCYFSNQNQQPNIVIIVVESLGADLFGVNMDNCSFTPFLDSLSKSSLLWTNCLSTTPRSFGAVPAITGSVPHGLKGFQFGDIPTHNSLFSILKTNNYTTHAFYAGNFSFDRIYDYLIAQQIDFLSPFYEEYKNLNCDERDGTYWGYNDKPMFLHSLDYISKRNTEKSFLDLFITISQHEDLQLKNKKLEQQYYKQAEQKVAQLSKETKTLFQNKIGFLASTLYTDNAIQELINAYQKLGLAQNTIFVITGDHSMNLDVTNPLDSYHVPLIIWSPLLKKSQRFSSVVSHSDITPSLIALLNGNYNMPKPKTVQWISDGLDTSIQFQCNIHNYFLRYSREIVDGVFGNYYYTNETGEPQIYNIHDGLKTTPVQNSNIEKQLTNQFNAITYVDNYVYINNYLTKNPPLPPKVYNKELSFSIDSLCCKSPIEKPSKVGRNYSDIFKNDIPCKADEIKIQITADMLYTGNVWQDQFISFVLTCKGENLSIFYEDYISKYIQARKYSPNTWYPIRITKTIDTKDCNNVKLAIYLSTTHKDDKWNPEHSVHLKNIQFTLYEANSNVSLSLQQ